MLTCSNITCEEISGVKRPTGPYLTTGFDPMKIIHYLLRMKDNKSGQDLSPSTEGFSEIACREFSPIALYTSGVCLARELCLSAKLFDRLTRKTTCAADKSRDSQSCA